MGFRHNICVDVDGVLLQYHGYRGEDHFGDPIPGAVEFTKNLHKIGRVIIHTARCRLPGKEVTLKQYLDQHGFVYDQIHTGVGKPIASVYIDDRAVVCQPQERDDAFIEAVKAAQVLIAKGNKTEQTAVVNPDYNVAGVPIDDSTKNTP